MTNACLSSQKKKQRTLRLSLSQSDDVGDTDNVDDVDDGKAHTQNG
jgi:hypothetical protein